MSRKVRCYSYVRFSSKQQEIGDSRARQIRETERWCERHGFHLEELTFEDLGVSAFRGKNWDANSALSSFKEMVEDGEIPKGSVLVVESLDRLSRQSILTAVNSITSLLDLGIEIQTLIPEQRYRRDSGVHEIMLMVSMFFAANQKSQWTSTSVKRAWENVREKTSKGNVPGMHKIPSWLKRNRSGKIVLDNDKAKIVRRIFQMYGRDGFSVGKIRDVLSEEDVPPISGSKSWNKLFFTRLLKERAVIGEIQYYESYYVEESGGKKVKRRRRISDEWHKIYPAAVSSEVYEKAQLKKKVMGGKRSGKVRTYIVPGNFIRCGHCGERMYPVLKREGFTSQYYCSGAVEKKNKCEVRNGYPVDEFELQFLNFVSELDLDSIRKDGSKAQMNSQQRRLSKLRKDLERLEREKKIMGDDIAAGRASFKDLRDPLQKVNDAINVNAEKIEQIVTELGLVNDKSESISSLQSNISKVKDIRSVSDEDRYRISYLVSKNVESVIMFPSRRRQDFTAFRSDKAGWEKFLKKNRLHSHLEYQRQLRCFYVRLKGEKGLRIVRGVEKMYRGGQTAKILNPRLVLDWKK